jgi:hypothetical protein
MFSAQYSFVFESGLLVGEKTGIRKLHNWPSLYLDFTEHRG